MTCKLKTWNKQELQLQFVINDETHVWKFFIFYFPSNQTNLRNISHHVFFGGKGKKFDLVGGSIYHHTNENQHDFQGGVEDILKMVEQAKMLSWAWVLSKYCRIIQQNTSFHWLGTFLIAFEAPQFTPPWYNLLINKKRAISTRHKPKSKLFGHTLTNKNKLKKEKN